MFNWFKKQNIDNDIENDMDDIKTISKCVVMEEIISVMFYEYKEWYVIDILFNIEKCFSQKFYFKDITESKKIYEKLTNYLKEYTNPKIVAVIKYDHKNNMHNISFSFCDIEEYKEKEEIIVN